eukprot:CAMPEP_0179374862 /NCGR_PEP_ID=MMETSP0797-20121207/87516_1 /TAXON_ID=47934 /ORGANISM="Dinophysis acuminata, Strain DAEP01" /LENGTH=294 /DNA_ID=CAMNT_0021090871 /DNA_START=84 /DNA_END=968 /DNA_ORIENTATION=-
MKAQPRGIVQTPLGGVHYVTSGSFESSLTPIVAFHMSPRSVDEYLEAMPLLSRDGRLVVAIDELGYGASDSPCRSCTLEEIADGALLVADHLGIQSFIACGSLMGNFFSIALGSKYIDRVKAIIMTNCYMFPEEVVQRTREKLAKRASGDTASIEDSWELKEDGSHLTAIFDARKGWLDPVMNTRATRDALIYNLKRRTRYADGVDIQDGPLFEFEARARNVRCPVLAINGTEAAAFFDKIGMPFTSQFEKLRPFFKDITVSELDTGHINLVNTHATEWCAKVMQSRTHRTPPL